MVSVLKVMVSAVVAFLADVSGWEALDEPVPAQAVGGYDGLSPMAKAF